VSHAGVTERVARFGAGSGLVGIVTEPEARTRAADAPVAIFLNSGIIHRVGASRLYVQMARRLAADGFTSLRFDFSGIGDSEARRDALRFEESAILEVQSAMNYLEESVEGRTFVLAGLCSGADMAHEVGAVDPRVVGLVQLDPYAYRTWRWLVRYYGPRIFRPGVWRNSVRVRWKALMERLRPPEDDGSSAVFVAPEYRRVLPPRQTVETRIAAMTDRGVRFFVCFTGDEWRFLYAGQYAESYPSVAFRDRLTVRHLPEASHTFAEVPNQITVSTEVARWFSIWRTAPALPEFQPLERMG